jgi:predicted aconitase with swiveling domain
VIEMAGRALAHGRAEGPALVLSEPLSFWGGVDPGSGLIIDMRHQQAGADVSGTILFMPSGRGSSSSSAVLAEAIRAGRAPAGIVLIEPDGILAVGAMVASLLYDASHPVVVLDERDHRKVLTGVRVSVEAPAGSAARVLVADGRPDS